MVISHDLLAYHSSIADELAATKDRIRHLIGDEHWLTDGEHKESILRTLLQTHLPETVRIGKGFICYPGVDKEDNSKSSSGQLDILITNKSKPTLFKDGELVFVTANAVEAIIEVKTRLYKKQGIGGLRTVLEKLSDQAEQLRKRKSAWIGLFVFEQNDTEHITHEHLLELLFEVTGENQNRAINCITLGDQTFVRFFPQALSDTSEKAGPGWYSYALDSLAPAYFVSNLVLSIAGSMTSDSINAWFPIAGTKQVQKIAFKALSLKAKTKFGNEFAEVVYTTRDGNASFRFRYVKLARHYEVDIVTMPSYEERSEALQITHRLASTRGGHMICFRNKNSLTNLSYVRGLAEKWAECTWNYIKTGKWA